jgi:hypothetical protein
MPGSWLATAALGGAAVGRTDEDAVEGAPMEPMDPIESMECSCDGAAAGLDQGDAQPLTDRTTAAAVTKARALTDNPLMFTTITVGR